MRFFSLMTLLVPTLVLATASTAAAKVVTFEITADEMCCKGCAKKIAAQLYTAPGVSNVKADVPARAVTVTATDSTKLTAERIWTAVEKGKGKPSKLVSESATYTLTPPEKTTADTKPSPGVHTVVVSGLKSSGAAEKVGREVQAIRGVKTVVLHLEEDSLLVQTQPGVQLSPFALVSAVERSGQKPVAVFGSYGRLTIEPNADKLSSRQQTQGAVR